MQISPKAAERLAKMAGRSAEFTAQARHVQESLKKEAPVEKGDYRDSIKMKNDRHSSGALDRVIYTDDPEAFIIEFPHLNTKTGKWHNGHFTFTNTLSRLRRQT